MTDRRAAEVVGAPRPPARLLGPLFLSNLALFSTYLGAAAILLPEQIAAMDADPVRKALNLSLVTGTAGVVALFAQPIFGALSDRTGRRNPWILWCGLIGACGLLTVAGAGALVTLVVVWSGTSILLNGFQMAVTAVVPDRIPEERRGMASAVVGAATPLSAVVGVGVANRFVHEAQLGWIVFAVMVAGSAVLMITGNREPRRPRRVVATLGRQLHGMVSALGHRDFRLTFLSRFAMMMAYRVVFQYLLFTLQVRIRLPSGWTAVDVLAALTVVGALCMLLGNFAGGLLADRLQRYRVFVIAGAALIAAAAIPPIVSTSTLSMFVYIAAMGVGFGGFLAVDTAIATLVLPRAEDAGRDLGVLNVANAAPQAFASFLAGLIVAALGAGPDAYGALFLVSIGFAVVGGLTILGVRTVR